MGRRSGLLPFLPSRLAMLCAYCYHSHHQSCLDSAGCHCPANSEIPNSKPPCKMLSIIAVYYLADHMRKLAIGFSSLVSSCTGEPLLWYALGTGIRSDHSFVLSHPDDWFTATLYDSPLMNHVTLCPALFRMAKPGFATLPATPGRVGHPSVSPSSSCN